MVEHVGRAFWLLNIHLYGGLVSCWYLLIYGVTPLDFNHPWLHPEARGEPVKWERAITVPNLPDNVKLGEAIRYQLDLIGWVIPWNMRRDGAGNLQFELSRPGKNYTIATDRGREKSAWRSSAPGCARRCTAATLRTTRWKTASGSR
ncbi:MAG: hypothetical protein L0Z50_39025 [Verrucomicrobiales bacterium]|nr:hypothetical protein [Verrucomicrobiales bacterium]